VKRKEILEEVEKWIAQADKKEASYIGIVYDHNATFCNEFKVRGKYKEALIKEYEELKTLLNNLPEPNLSMKQEEITFQTQKPKKVIKAKELKLGEIDVSYSQSSNK
jgi:hypothetical protein